MRLERLRLELRMELAANKMRMIRQLHHLHVSSIRRRSGNAQARSRHGLFVLAIELIAMPVPLADFERAINLLRQGIGLNLAWPRPQSHRPAQFLYAPQLAQLVDHTMWRRGIELA